MRMWLDFAQVGRAVLQSSQCLVSFELDFEDEWPPGWIAWEREFASVELAEQVAEGLLLATRSGRCQFDDNESSSSVNDCWSGE